MPFSTDHLLTQKDQVAAMLFRFSSMLQHRAFLNALYARANRFDIDYNDALFDKLEGLFWPQVDSFRNCYSSGYTRTPVAASRADKASYLKEVAEIMQEKSLAMTELKLNKYKFTLSARTDYVQVVKNELEGSSNGCWKSFVTFVHEITTPGSDSYVMGLRLDYLTGLYNAFLAMVVSMETLKANTQIPCIEACLDFAMMKGENYWAEGYPHDILWIDVVEAQKNPLTIECVRVKETHASSVLLRHGINSELSEFHPVMFKNDNSYNLSFVA